MKRLPVLFVLLLSGFLMMGADGCSSDPNVEGAKLDLRNKDYDRALANLATALEKNPQNATALELKGKVLEEKAMATNDAQEHVALMTEAMESFHKAAELDPAIAASLKNTIALAYYNEFQRGAQAFNRGKNDPSAFDDAVLYFKTTSMIAPDSTGPYVNEAFAYMNAGKDELAIEPFEKALEHGDTQADTYTFLGNLYMAHDRADDAVSLLETAYARYPGNTDMEAQLLNAYTVAGQLDRALEKYEDAVKADPNNKVYQYNFGSLLLQTEDYDKAIEHLKKAVSLDPTYANAQYNLGAAYVNKAVEINEEISAMDDDLRANESKYSKAEKKAKQDEMDRMTEERRGLFALAIEPLEIAKAEFESQGQENSDLCRVLFQSYVQTNQTDKAESVSECAGYSDLN